MAEFANAPDNLTPAQEAAILALLNEPTIRKAAETCGTPERTLYRWLDDEHFSRAYRKARRQSFAQAIALTNRYTPMAVNNLAVISNDKSAPHAARVSASSALLKFSRESIELDDVVERVEALERDQKQREQNP